MNAFERRRLRAPLFTAVCGLALAVPVAVVAGWAAGVPVAAIAAVAAGVYYWLGGTDTDIGALIGSRADERQASVRVRVRACAGVVMLAAGAIGGVVSATLGDSAWPYALVVGLGAVCFFAGLTFYRRGGRLADSGFRRGPGVRLDEREAAAVLHALQLAGIVTFLVAAIGGVALSGKSGADSLRILAIVFAVAVIVGFLVFRPGVEGREP
jgi:hypothetical protein